MPTYEFRCPAGHTFDQFFRSIGSAPTQVSCPQCGETAERQISGGAGLHFKGSGFYLTDYGKNAHRSGAAPKAGGESGGSDAGSSGSSDKGGDKGAAAKPAAAPAKDAPSGSGGSSSGGSSSGGSSGTSGSSGAGA